MKVLLTALALSFSAGSAPAKDVYYPIETGRGGSASLEYQVLELALSKSGGDWELKPSPYGPANEVRQRALLRRGDGLHVAWFGTSAEFEETLLPVHFPISGGLLGWRLLLIDGERQPEFSAVRSLRNLQSLAMGQGKGWGDIEILEASGLTVRTSNYENLFGMVTAGRIDAFPRAAHEAFREHAKYSNKVPGLAVEQDMVLRYPFAMLYHVAKNNSELHDAILKGLQQAHADGSYHELFFNHPSIRSVLEMARLGERRLIEIDNPSLSEALRSIPGQYWMTFDGS